MNHSIRYLSMAAVLAVAIPCLAAPVELEVEKDSKAVEGGRLVQDIGIETLGGVFTPLLARGLPTPCEVTETFSTAADNQDQVQVRLFRGTAKLTKDATVVGRVRIEGLPKRPRGKVNVSVTFTVTAQGSIGISATERGGHPVCLRRDDG
jgi:molecular chaperone DnaK (HSP70)